MKRREKVREVGDRKERERREKKESKGRVKEGRSGESKSERRGEGPLFFTPDSCPTPWSLHMDWL